MRLILTAAAALVLATPTLAAADTLQEVVKHGIVLTVQGMDIEVDYKPDGSFTALDGQVTGKWRIDGDKLCTSSNFAPEESCTAYPKDKKSGDTFTLKSDQGDAQIKIK